MKKSRFIMILGVLLPLGLFLFPLWNITLEAPQYPIPLGMDIYIDKFADMNEFDIKNINLMNHYVGMQYIPETIPEFKIFPIAIITGMYDFYLWEYDYGHNLDPKAIMNFKNPDGSVMGFQPPLFGTKHILNFIAHSYPKTGAYFLASGMFLAFVAFFVGKKEAKNA